MTHYLGNPDQNIPEDYAIRVLIDDRIEFFTKDELVNIKRKKGTPSQVENLRKLFQTQQTIFWNRS